MDWKTEFLKLYFLDDLSSFGKALELNEPFEASHDLGATAPAAYM